MKAANKAEKSELDVYVIFPLGIYTDALLGEMLGASTVMLRKARRFGFLQSKRIGTQNVYLGEWVLAWLRAEPEQKESDSGEEGSVDEPVQGEP